MPKVPEPEECTELHEGIENLLRKYSTPNGKLDKQSKVPFVEDRLMAQWQLFEVCLFLYHN